MALTLEEANRVADGALAKARALGIAVSVAVCRSAPVGSSSTSARASYAVRQWLTGNRRCNA